MSNPSLTHFLQFRNVIVAPQTPNLQQMKQLRIKAKNKLKDVILPTNPPTPKTRKNQLSKKSINKSKENIPLILNENKKLPKNLSFHYLHANIKNIEQINCSEGHTSPTTNDVSNFNIHQNQVYHMNKKIKKDNQNNEIIKTSRSKIKQNNMKFNNECFTFNNNEKTVNNLKSARKQFTNHIPILHMTHKRQQKHQNFNYQRYSSESDELNNEYFSPITIQHNEQQYYESNKLTNEPQLKAQQLQNFKDRSQQFQSHLLNHQKQLLFILQSHEHNFMQNSTYIQRSFKQVISSLEQKQRQLINTLYFYQQNIKSKYKENLNEIMMMRKSIQRYKKDIQRHYEDIVMQLDMIEFEKIIRKYDDKLEYFGKELDKIATEMKKKNVNVYVPVKEIWKLVQKSDVKSYDYGEGEVGAAYQNHTIMNGNNNFTKIIGNNTNYTNNHNINQGGGLNFNENRQVLHKRNISLKDNHMLMKSNEKCQERFITK